MSSIELCILTVLCWHVCVGIAAELYYVRDGVVNDYALSFVLPVKTDVDSIYFDWQSLRNGPLDQQVIQQLQRRWRQHLYCYQYYYYYCVQVSTRSTVYYACVTRHNALLKLTYFMTLLFLFWKLLCAKAATAFRDCFQRILAIAILSVCLSVCHTGGSVKDGAS